VWLSAYFFPKDSYLQFNVADWKPQFGLWKRLLAIGLPAGAEFGLMAVYLFIVYGVSRRFGSSAQAGFGIGLRIIQAGFMPVVALGFAVAPVAGQNFGGRKPDRVRQTFRSAVLMAAGVMLGFMLLVMATAHRLVEIFSADPQVIAVGSEYLRILSWTFIMSGIVFVGSSMFQAMGNTMPALIASFTRIVLVAIPALLFTRMAGFELRWIWYLSVAAGTVQLALNLTLLSREFRRRLRPLEIAAAAPVAPIGAAGGG
jgi:Na+-driven multidrug efflux pump